MYLIRFMTYGAYTNYAALPIWNFDHKTKIY